MVKTFVKKQIGVIGAGACGSEIRVPGETVGREVDIREAILLC